MKIYLASKSPRRRELLVQIGVQFDVLNVDTPEQQRAGESALDYSLRVTQEKMQAGWQKVIQEHYSPRPILCADTEVILDGDILGKPANDEDAQLMLKRLSGRTHEVITTVGLRYFEQVHTLTDTTEVTFEAIPHQAITHYVQSGVYRDKSGGYGIQSDIGQFISRINGSFHTVMGLPLHQVRQLLSALNVTDGN